MDEAEIIKRLDRIEHILLQTPEVLSATFITMWEEWQVAQFRGKSAKDLWKIIPSNGRQSQSPGVVDPGLLEGSSGES